MSRLVKNYINFPKTVNVNVINNIIYINGPKGKLSKLLDKNIKVEYINGIIILNIKNRKKKIEHSLYNLYYVLINNMIYGVLNGYKKYIDVIGVGYKVIFENNLITLNLGFSHDIFILCPNKIKCKVNKGKLKDSTKIILTSCDKELLGDFAAKIRYLKSPDPYKGKGIRYTNEFILKKTGKST